MGDTRERIIFEADGGAFAATAKGIESRFEGITHHIHGISSALHLATKALAGFGLLHLLDAAIEKASQLQEQFAQWQFSRELAAAGGAKPGSTAAGGLAEVDRLKAELAKAPGFWQMMTMSAAGLGGTLFGMPSVSQYAEEQLAVMKETRDVLKERLAGAELSTTSAATRDTIARAKGNAILADPNVGRLDLKGKQELTAGIAAGFNESQLLQLISDNIERLAQIADKQYAEEKAARNQGGPSVVNVAAAGPD